MKAEIRADGMHISGYVNVPGRESRPIRSALGSFIEIIEPGVFQRAISKSKNLNMVLDHDRSRVLAKTADGTLNAKEDNIGLRAEAVITDEEVIKEAKAGRLKGWSFGMVRPKYKTEERAEGEMPVRRVTDIERLTEITLVLNRVPCYQATSIELRSDGEEDLVEYRTDMEDIDIVQSLEAEPEDKPDMSEYRKRLNNL